MTDCPNAEIRDLLPDWVAGALRPADRARVAGHLAGCAECRAEAALLASARQAMPAGPAIDVARVVAALPAPPAAVAGARRIARPPAPAWRSWRAAAAVAAVAIAGSSLVLARGGSSDAGVPAAVGARSDTAAPDSAPRVVADTAAGGLLAFLDADDLTATEYDALVSELGADVEPFAPIAEPATDAVLGGTL